MAIAPVMRAVEKLGGKPELRMGVNKDGPVITDQGNMVLDVKFDAINNPAELEQNPKQYSRRAGKWPVRRRRGSGSGGRN